MESSIGSRIKELRTLSGLSQEELGKRVGVQRAAINKYETGVVENIPIKTIERIAKALDVSPTYLVGWSSENASSLAMEVKVIRGVKVFYGADAVELLETFSTLSIEGKKRVCVYADDISKVFGVESAPRIQ